MAWHFGKWGWALGNWLYKKIVCWRAKWQSMKTFYLDDDLLCRYIPENFYSDFAISDGSGGQSSGKGGVPDYLETVVAGKGITSTTVSAQPTQLQPNSLQPAVTGAGAVQQPQTVIQPAFSMAGSSSNTEHTKITICFFFLITLTLFLAGTSIQQPQLITSPTAGSNTVVSGATGSCATTPQQLTIQLPTQPQPIQGVKTVTYVNPVLSTPATRPTQIQTSPTVTAASTTLQPVKMTTTPTFAYTPSGRCHICFGRPVKEVVAGFTFLAWIWKKYYLDTNALAKFYLDHPGKCTLKA